MKLQDPIRVLILIDGLGIGGAERLLIPYLQYIDRQRYEPIVCALHHRDGVTMTEAIRTLDIKVDTLDTGRLCNPRSYQLLRQYIRTHNIQLLHCHLHDSIILGGFTAHRMHLPCVATIHTLPSEPFVTRAYWRTQLADLVMMRYFDRVIAVSQEVYRHYDRIQRRLQHRMLVVHNGIDLAPFASVTDRAALRRSLGIQTDALVLIGVGVLRPAKGYQYLIEAMPQILADVPQAHLLIVGGGDHETVLMQQIQQLGLQSHITMSGPRNDIPQLLQMSDLFVHPSLLDALPTVIMEAMAAGLPIIATHVNGIPELVEPGLNGLLVAPGTTSGLAEVCVTLLRDPDACSTMKMESRLIVQNRFNVHNHVRQLAAVYDAILREYQQDHSE